MSSWICPSTWALIDRRSSMRKHVSLTRLKGRRLGQEIKGLIRADRIKRGRKVGEVTVLLLAEGELKELGRAVQGWYK